MTKSKKIWIGIFSILPGLLFGLYILVFISTFFFAAVSGEFEPGHRGGTPPFLIMMPIAMLMFFIGFALTTAITIYHVIHISKSNMSSNDKLIWILVVILLNWLGDVAYWYVKIWKEEPPALTGYNPTPPPTNP